MLSLFKSNCINLAKFFRLFYTKNLLFLFYTTTLPKHPHQYSHMGENLEVEASRSGQQQGRSKAAASRQIQWQQRWQIRQIWLDFELGFLMVWFDFLLILGKFCGGLSTVEMGCSGGGWVVLG